MESQKFKDIYSLFEGHKVSTKRTKQRPRTRVRRGSAVYRAKKSSLNKTTKINKAPNSDNSDSGITTGHVYKETSKVYAANGKYDSDEHDRDSINVDYWNSVECMCIVDGFRDIGTAEPRLSRLIDINDIGETGAIKSGYNKRSSDIMAQKDIFEGNQYYIGSSDEYYSDNSYESQTFERPASDVSADCDPLSSVAVPRPKSRKSEIAMDLFDLICSSDSDCDEITMPVSQLLDMFGLSVCSDANIHNFFANVLCIQHCYEITDIPPNSIRSHTLCINLQQLKKVNRLCKYVSIQCQDNRWIGSESKQWIELESNCFNTISQPKSPYLLNNGEFMEYYKQLVSHGSDSIVLNGFEKKLTHCIGTQNFEEEITLKLLVKQLPNKHKFENELFKFGIETNDTRLYIGDRLILRNNEAYVGCMFVNEFIQTYSSVFITMKTVQVNTQKMLNCKFSHQPKGFNHGFSKNIQIPIQQSTENIKVYIQQFKGNGLYSIQQL